MQSEPGSSSIEEILKIISTAKAKDDPFAILGINPDATEQEIRRSYRRLAVQLHPDKNQNFQAAEEAFKYLSQAYKQVLEMNKPPILVQQVLQVNPNEPLKIPRRNGTNVYQNTDTETYKRYSQFCNNLLKKLSQQSSLNSTSQQDNRNKRKREDEEHAEILLDLKRQNVGNEPNTSSNSDSEHTTSDTAPTNPSHRPSHSTRSSTTTERLSSYSGRTEKISLSDSETESENELSTSYSSDHSNSTTTTTTVHERSHSSTSRRDTSQTNTNLQHSTFQSTNNHSKNFASSNKQSSSPTCSMPSANSPINCNIFHSQQLDINENKTPTKSHPFNQSHPISKINGNSNNNINNNPVNSRKKQTRIQRAGCHSLSSPTTNDPKMKISLNDIHMFISQKLRQLHECPDENIKRQEPLILGLQQRFLCRQTTSTTSDNSSNPTNPSTPTSTTTTTVTASISTTTFTHQSIGTIHKTFLTSMTTSLPNSNPPPIPPRTQS